MKKLFNLIEVTLAIAVVGIGIAGIMSLFPVGIQASRDAVGDNYAADSVEQMLGYIAAACQNDWTTFISNVDEGVTAYDPEPVPTNANCGNITEKVPFIPETLTSTTTNWTPISGTNLSRITGLGTLRASPSFSTDYNIYGIKQPATGNTDFTAHVKLWKAPISNMTIAGVSGITMPYYQVAGANKVGAARIYAEVSWPVEKPYSNRTKRVYAIELFKQN